MAYLTVDCARCGANQMTHDVRGCSTYPGPSYEYYLQCRKCYKSATWEIIRRPNKDTPVSYFKYDTLIDDDVLIGAVVRPKPDAVPTPDHTPPDLKLIFDEGAECISVGAWNAACAMFRKILDQVSKDKMNAAPSGPPPDKRTRFSLKPRLEWLFANNLLPKDVEALADCIREDANDAVHNTPLSKDDALDLQDFTVEMLEALFTLPGRLKDAEARRAARRGA
ncbi:DUF4145 domain-containing protein [Bradyrhizobium sp. CCGUVB14]|uniref:DUF4145 domain-containing protein n=1 Tax=Bradyrhizobium sp. CCGUVB14 TaxID=2949628 RepID=UPI0020B30B44|nr:DUF4145 domain-containing protein [Bradyrhizobium sp. CCGUVB14]MCP3444077.1 DUF4145 domain-containing protein [Bradyrhizobium sp. CCGUVB14]